MIDIIILFYLCWKNSKKAQQKGLPPKKWIWYTIAAWLIGEFFGILLGVMLLGKRNFLLYDQQDYTALLAMGLISAFGGYLYIRAKLEKMQTPKDDEVDRIGISDLRPPNKNEENV
jgi:polyferredoxin